MEYEFAQFRCYALDAVSFELWEDLNDFHGKIRD